jgi:hypothetical protein
MMIVIETKRNTVLFPVGLSGMFMQARGIPSPSVRYNVFSLQP